MVTLIGRAILSGTGRQAASKSPQILRNEILKEAPHIFINNNPEEGTNWQDQIDKEREEDNKETQRERYRALDKDDGASKNKGNYTDPKSTDPSKTWEEKIIDERSQVEPDKFRNPLDEVQTFETASLNNPNSHEAQILEMMNDGFSDFLNDNFQQDFSMEYADIGDPSDGDSASDGGDGGAMGGGDGGE